MAEVAEIVIGIKTQLKDFKKGIDESTRGIRKFGGEVRRVVNENALIFGAAFGGVAAGLAKVTSAASDLEETQSKFNTVFRGSIPLAEEGARVLQESYLLSETAAKQFLAGIQDTLVPMGVAREEATGLSTEVIKLAADLGSFNNLPTEQVVRDLQSALVGNTETVKKYGVVLRATDIEQRAMTDNNIKQRTEVTQAQKVMAAYNIILDATTDAQGDVIRTSDSFANKMKNLQGRFADLQTTVGSFTLGSGTDFVTFLTDLVQKNNDALKTIQDTINEFGNFGTVLKSAMIEALRDLIKATIDYVNVMTGLGPLLKLIGVDLDNVKQRLDSQIDSWQASSQAAALSAKEAADAERKKQDAIKKTSEAQDGQNNKAEESTDKQIRASERLKRFQEDSRVDKLAAEDEDLRATILRIETEAERRRKALQDTFDASAQTAEDQAALDEARKNLSISTDAEIAEAREANLTEFEKGSERVRDAMVNSISDAVSGMILQNESFEKSFKRVMDSILQTAVKTFAKIAIERALSEKSAGGAVGGIGGAVGIGLFGSVAPKLLKGIKFAEGGIVNKPTIGLVGEKGPEAIIPLSRAGQIGGNVQVTVRQSNTISLSGTDETQAKNLMKKISEMTRNGAAEGAEMVKSILARQNRVTGQSV